MVVCLRCLLHHILSLIVYTFRENREFVFIVLCSLWWVQIFGYVLACRSYSFVCTLHHLIIIIVQTLSQLSIIQYVGLCDFSLPIFPCDDWQNVYTLSYYQHQIVSMNYYPLLKVRSWNNGMRCMSFYIFIAWDLGQLRSCSAIDRKCRCKKLKYGAKVHIGMT